MDPVQQEPQPWLPGGLPAIAISALVAVISVVALGLDAVVAFWALTVGLPLVGFVVIIIVVLARRMTVDDEDRAA